MRRTTAAAVVALLAFAGTAHAQSSIPSNDEIFATVEDVVEFSPRRVGTPGIDKTVEYIAAKYREYGLTRVHVEEVPTYSWAALGHSLSFAGKPIDASPVIYSQSPAHDAVGERASDLTAPVVDIGGATAADVARHDVKGKIALFDLKFLLPVAGLLPFTEFLWDPLQTMLLSPQTMLTANPYITTYTEAVKAAQDAGAVGFVGVLSDYFDSNRYYNESYRRQLVSIPGMWITKAAGGALRAQLAADPGAQARLVLKSKREKVPSHVVVGFLDGKSSDAIQVHSHHDSGFDGAVEDASGVAEVLALARHYSRQPASSREKTLMFTTFDSHWSGYAAHNTFLKRHVARRNPARDPNRIVADVTLEHIAKHALRDSAGKLVVSDLPEPRGIFENLSPLLKARLIASVVRNDLRRTAILNGSVLQPAGIPTDSSGWVILGVPTAALISGPMYLYDAADTPDKVLKSELQKVARTFIELVDAMDTTPSDQLGLLPQNILGRIGELFGGDIDSVPDSVDRPAGLPPAGCVAAKSGRAVTRVRITRTKGLLRLRFRARRTITVRTTALLPRGRRRGLRALRVRACRDYAITLPRASRGARVSWRGGALTVRR